MDRQQAWLVVLLMLASGKRPRSSGAPGGPWPPGEDNLGTQPVPDGSHPQTQKPPLK